MKKIIDYIRYTKLGKVALLVFIILISATYVGMIDEKGLTAAYSIFYYIFIGSSAILAIFGVFLIGAGIYNGIKEVISVEDKIEEEKNKRL